MRKTRRKILAEIAGFMALLPLLCSCGLAGKGKIRVWPDGWVIEQTEDGDSGKEGGTGKEGSSKSENAGIEAASPKKAESVQAQEADGLSTSNTGAIDFYPDLSRSAASYASIDKVYEAVRSAAGSISELRCWGVDQEVKSLTPIDYKKVFGAKDLVKSPIDYLMLSEHPYDPGGAGVLVTDLMTSTGSEFGRWLVSTGSDAFSFYVFTLPFDGEIDFYGYESASADKSSHFHVSECRFVRDLLMIVFGDRKTVDQFDREFKSAASSSDLTFDMAHVAGKADGSGFTVLPAPCFTENLSNITYDGNNYCYGLSLSDSIGTCFTLPSTFVFTRSRLSANEKKKAVRAVFYGVPNDSLGKILETGCGVQEYDRKEKCWKDSAVSFEVSATGYLDGFPASLDEEMNERLGGDIIPHGKVCAVSIENDNLPKGLYAVEPYVVFEAAENTGSLRQFSDRHSASIGDYIGALDNECVKVKENRYSMSKENSAVFSRLLDFRGMVDELTAAGFSDPTAENTNVILRAVIDSR